MRNNHSDWVRTPEHKRSEPNHPTRLLYKEMPSHQTEAPKQQVHQKFQEYTPLTVNMEQIMNAIGNEPYIQHPNPLCHGPNKDKNKYCSYHKDIEHTTEQCVKLKDEIEFLIEKGYLKEFIHEN